MFFKMLLNFALKLNIKKDMLVCINSKLKRGKSEIRLKYLPKSLDVSVSQPVPMSLCSLTNLAASNQKLYNQFLHTSI